MHNPDFSAATPPVCCDVSAISLERRTSPVGEHGALFTLRLRSPGWEAWHPGQFVMLRPKRMARPDVYWARPFSISQADGEEVRVLFQVAGRGTEELSELQRGGIVTMWGPLGNAFAVSPSGPTLLLAGGIGIAPFVGYIERHPAPETLRMEFGHKMPLDCYPFAECRDMRCSPPEARAIRNHHETCPADLVRFIGTMEEGIRDIAGRKGLVLACGPMPFLKCVQKFALQYGARAQLSLETRMACGVGACLGCVVKAAAPQKQESPATPPAFSYVQTCTKGPVFWADQIDLEN